MGTIDHTRWQFVRRIRLAGMATEITIEEIKQYADSTGHIGLFHHRHQPDYVRLEMNPKYDESGEYCLPVEGFQEIFVGDSSSLTLVMLVSSTTVFSLYRGKK